MKNFPCFVINLEKDVSKKLLMQDECKKVGINPIFTNAIYGAHLSNTEINKVYSKEDAVKYFNRELTKGEIGTALSHLHIYKYIVDKSIPYALVLEDDVELPDNIKQLTNILYKLPNDWEIVLLGHHTGRSRTIDTLASVWNQYKVDNKYRCIRFAEDPFGAYGYLISINGARKLLKQFSLIDRPIDHWNDKTVNLYGINPSFIIVNDEFISDSLLLQERSDMLTARTLFQKFKDMVQKMLKRLNLFEMYFSIKNFLLQFKNPRRYES